MAVVAVLDRVGIWRDGMPPGDCSDLPDQDGQPVFCAGVHRDVGSGFGCNCVVRDLLEAEDEEAECESRKIEPRVEGGKAGESPETRSAQERADFLCEGEHEEDGSQNRRKRASVRVHFSLKKIAFPLARCSFVWVDCSAAKQRVTGA